MGTTGQRKGGGFGLKSLYLIGGPMGVGKTTVGQILKRRLDRSVLLDGDWCWDAHPFQVTEETRAMVLDNICHLLGNFLSCSAYEHVIFCWVLHRQAVIDAILSRLEPEGCRVVQAMLLCSPAALERRLRSDIAQGLRQPDVIPRALERLVCCEGLNIPKIDTTSLTPEGAAQAVLRLGNPDVR